MTWDKGCDISLDQEVESLPSTQTMEATAKMTILNSNTRNTWQGVSYLLVHKNISIFNFPWIWSQQSDGKEVLPFPYSKIQLVTPSNPLQLFLVPGEFTPQGLVSRNSVLIVGIKCGSIWQNLPWSQPAANTTPALQHCPTCPPLQGSSAIPESHN